MSIVFRGRHRHLGYLKTDIRQVSLQFLDELRTETLGKEIEYIPVFRRGRPFFIPVDDLGEGVPVMDLLDKGPELNRVGGRQAPR
jgi:hypothetical protein